MPLDGEVTSSERWRQGELLRLTLFSERHDGVVFFVLKKRRLRPPVVRWTPRMRRVWKTG